MRPSLRVAGEVLGGAAMCLIRGRPCRHNLLTLAQPRSESGARRHVVETLGSSHCWMTPAAPPPGREIATTVRHRHAVAGPEPRSHRLASGRPLHPSSPRPRIRRRCGYMRLADGGDETRRDLQADVPALPATMEMGVVRQPWGSPERVPR